MTAKSFISRSAKVSHRPKLILLIYSNNTNRGLVCTLVTSYLITVGRRKVVVVVPGGGGGTITSIIHTRTAKPGVRDLWA